MKWIQIMLTILNAAALLYLTVLAVFAMTNSKTIKLEKSHEEHCCNHCDISYNDGLSIMFKYCPLCGRKLTLHKDHPDYEELYGFTFEEEQEFKKENK